MTRILCTTCGALLIEEVSAEGVRPVGAAEPIPFRRHTDYVMCERCLTTYDVASLIEAAESEEVIAHLEKMAEEANAREPGA